VNPGAPIVDNARAHIEWCECNDCPCDEDDSSAAIVVPWRTRLALRWVAFWKWAVAADCVELCLATMMVCPLPSVVVPVGFEQTLEVRPTKAGIIERLCIPEYTKKQ